MTIRSWVLKKNKKVGEYLNILSVTEFAKQLGDEKGTDIDTKQKRSKFYQDNYKYYRTIHHPQSNLQEIQINEIFGLIIFYLVLVNMIINTATNFRYSC